MIENFLTKFKESFCEYTEIKYHNMEPNHRVIKLNDPDNPTTISNAINDPSLNRRIEYYNGATCTIKNLPNFNNVTAGDNITINIIPEYGTPIEYTWFEKKKTDSKFNAIPNETSNSLTLTLDDSYNDSYITCRVVSGTHNYYFFTPIASHITFAKTADMRPGEDEKAAFYPDVENEYIVDNSDVKSVSFESVEAIE